MYVAKVGQEKSLVEYLHEYEDMHVLPEDWLTPEFIVYWKLVKEKHIELESEVYTKYLYKYVMILYRLVQIFLDDPMGLELMRKMATSGMSCFYLKHKKLTSTNEIIEEVNRTKGQLLLLKNSNFAVVISKELNEIGVMKIKIFESYF